MKKSPDTHVAPLKGDLDGKVQVQFFEVNTREFDDFENISKALVRLDKGTYGRCTRCGSRIESDVLTEAPLATTCLDCSHRD